MRGFGKMLGISLTRLLGRGGAAFLGREYILLFSFPHAKIIYQSYIYVSTANKVEC